MLDQMDAEEYARAMEEAHEEMLATMPKACLVLAVTKNMDCMLLDVLWEENTKGPWGGDDRAHASWSSFSFQESDTRYCLISEWGFDPAQGPGVYEVELVWQMERESYERPYWYLERCWVTDTRYVGDWHDLTTDVLREVRRDAFKEAAEHLGGRYGDIVESDGPAVAAGFGLAQDEVASLAQDDEQEDA